MIRNFILDHEGFENYLLKKEPVRDMGGIQYVFRFPNDYGASVIKHRGSYGYDQDFWELAVIKFYGDDPEDWYLNYETDLTDDVIGWLTDEEVRDLLGQIMDLQKS